MTGAERAKREASKRDAKAAAYADACEMAHQFFATAAARGYFDYLRDGWEGEISRHIRRAGLHVIAITHGAYDAESVGRYVAEAMQWNPAHHESAMRVVAELLRQNAPLPEALKHVAIRTLERAEVPPKARGKPFMVLFRRDLMLATVIGKMLEAHQDRGLTVARNNASAPVSACDAIEHAWRQAKLAHKGFGGVDYSTARAAWRRIAQMRASDPDRQGNPGCLEWLQVYGLRERP
jgi:hypothetical protein